MPRLVGFLFALALFGRIYEPNTTTAPGSPLSQHPVIGEFGALYGYPGRLMPVGEVVTFVENRSGIKSISSVRYGVGLHYALTPSVTLEAWHSSWHNVDKVGPRETLNRLGLFIRL